MKCPHCLQHIHEARSTTPVEQDIEGGWVIEYQKCPACQKLIFYLCSGPALGRDQQGRFFGIANTSRKELIRPKGASRPPCPKEVPPVLAADYNEACLVLPDSPKASAALSRRCLQTLLRDEAKVKPGNLADEIQQVLDSGKLPSALADSIDAVRNIGNFAAHPMKSQHTGEILDVEPGEAEWNLDVLESLFDFYFVQPALLKAKRDALNAKLTAAGKPPMK
jgi:hypothetical protein